MEPLITRPPNEAGEKTWSATSSWCGVFNGANASMVDVKDGKMIRIRPARYYDQYTREEVKPWVMHARGKTFEPSDKSLIPPLTPRVQEAGLLPGPHPLSHEAGGLGPGPAPRLHRPRRPQRAEPRGEQVHPASAGTRRSAPSRRDAADRGAATDPPPSSISPTSTARTSASTVLMAACGNCSPSVRRLHPAGPGRRQLGM